MTEFPVHDEEQGAGAGALLQKQPLGVRAGSASPVLFHSFLPGQGVRVESPAAILT